MKREKRYVGVMLVALFLFNAIVPTMAFTEEAVVVMTLFEKKRYYAEVTMTPAQLSALAEQPGITVSKTPEVIADQIAIPIPSALGGGFIVSEPAMLAAGMNAVGITTVATEASVLGAIAAEGAITKDAIVAGKKVAAGITTGTIVKGAAILGGVIGAAAAAGGGGGGGTTTTTHH